MPSAADTENKNEKRIQLDTDWQANWHASLAVKVTAPLLWIIVLISIVFSIVTQRNIEQELSDTFSLRADWIAYQLGEGLSLTSLELDLDTLFATRLAPMFGKDGFQGMELRTGTTELLRQEGCTDLERLVRGIDLGGDINGNFVSAERAELVLCHLPIETLARHQRKQALVYYGIPFLLLGFMLAGMIHLIVTRPIQDMVKVTKRVTQGELDVHMDEKRQDEFGELARFINQMLDTLTRKHGELLEAVDDAERASKAKSIFLANMSHELRTPLNAIIGYTEIIMEDLLAQEDGGHTRDLERILNSARHLLELIDGILDLSKVEAGRMELSIHELDLVALVRAVADLVKPAADKNGNRFEFDIKEFSIKMVSDETKIRQILFNLVSNAAKFTHDGKIQISVDKVAYGEQPWVNITIEDNGIGMTQAQQQVVFQDFTQADISSTREYGGTGLGLTISQRFCRMLGGEITLISSQGMGSTFIVELPLEYLPPDKHEKISDQIA